MEDVKATPADFEIGDWSERAEPLGPFCVWHGYFGECPECVGSDVRWTATIVQADPQALIVDESWSRTGPSDTPSPGRAGLRAVARETPQVTAATGLGADVPVALDHTPVRVNPGLLARIRLLLEERDDA